jgi:hypothetical protein
MSGVAEKCYVFTHQLCCYSRELEKRSRFCMQMRGRKGKRFVEKRWLHSNNVDSRWAFG